MRLMMIVPRLSVSQAIYEFLSGHFSRLHSITQIENDSFLCYLENSNHLEVHFYGRIWDLKTSSRRKQKVFHEELHPV